MGESHKKTIVSLTVALNTSDLTTVHSITTKFQEYNAADVKRIAYELMNDEDVCFALKKSLTTEGAGAKDDDVCKWLYNWYQIDSSETRLFVLQFLPLLVWTYLYGLSINGMLPGIEACLLCIYNNDVVLRSGQDLMFNPPSLSVPSYLQRNPFGLHPSDSLYDNMNTANNPTLTENALRQFNKQAKALVTAKRIDALEAVTASTRHIVLKTALKKYNSYISYMPNTSLLEYCKMCKRLVSCGFNFTKITHSITHSKAFSDKYSEKEVAENGNDNNNNNIIIDEGFSLEDDGDDIQIYLNGEIDLKNEKGKDKVPDSDLRPKEINTTANTNNYIKTDNNNNTNGTENNKSNKDIFFKKPRIVLSPTVLQELVTGLTFCVFKQETHNKAIRALSLLHLRACHDLIPEVILSVNSLLHLDYNEQIPSSSSSSHR